MGTHMPLPFQAWDDVVRKERPKEEAFEYKKRLTLDHEKSKLSLAEIYEQEYIRLNQVGAARAQGSGRGCCGSLGSAVAVEHVRRAQAGARGVQHWTGSGLYVLERPGAGPAHGMWAQARDQTQASSSFY